MRRQLHDDGYIACNMVESDTNASMADVMCAYEHLDTLMTSGKPINVDAIRSGRQASQLT